MTCAVTGGTGFVGSHLVLALRARGDAVRCLVRPGGRPPEDCPIITGDLDDERALAALVEGVSVVYHVAGLIAGREADLLRVNRDGAARLAGAARAAGVRRLVLVSSLAVTGPTIPGRPLDDAAPPRPVTPYGRSKKAGEDAVRESGVAFTVVRPPVVYGPRDRQLLRLFRLARLGLVPLLGNGGQELSLVYAGDLAGALMAAAQSPAAEGRTYHAAHPQTLRQRELATAIGRAVGKRVRVLPVPGSIVRLFLRVSGLFDPSGVLAPAKAPELLAPAWTCSSDALGRDTGWRASTAHDPGLRRAAEAYRAAGWL